MPRETDRPSVPHSLRVPTGPAPTLRAETDEMQQAIELATSRAAAAVKLQIDAALGLLHSKSSMRLDRAGKVWKAIGIGAMSVSITMGTAMATCMNAYQDARFDVQEPVARAELKAERAAQSTAELTARMDLSDARHAKTATAIEEIHEALKANTRAVLGLAAKLERDEDRAPPPRKRGGSR